MIIIITSIKVLFGQTLPTGTCGIVFSYDAAGNQTKREFVLNNTAKAVEQVKLNGQIVAANNIIKVDALYPNPTTGQFSVRLVKPLVNGIVNLVDLSGRIILHRTENGNLLSFNISSQPHGIYILQIIQGEEKISMKVIKK